VVVALFSVSIPLTVVADARTDRLVDLLRNSGNYRVRVQSAQSLGRIRDLATAPALISALDDQHPAVRAAAAQALGRLGARDALPQLRRLAADRSQPNEVVQQAQRAVSQIQQIAGSGAPTKTAPPSGEIRYYIGVGEMGNTTGIRDGELEKTLGEMITNELGRAPGVKIAPPRETPNAAQKVIKKNGWAGYFLQGSVVRLEDSGGQIHALVSIMVLSNPGRDLRMMLHGRAAAGIPGGQKLSPNMAKSLQNYALKAAVKGAIQRLSQQLATGR